MIVALIRNPFLLDIYDLSSVTSIVIGAAPFGIKTAQRLQELRPKWRILSGYGNTPIACLYSCRRLEIQINSLANLVLLGLTEMAVVASHTSPHDVEHGSSGSLLPLVQARLIDSAGIDIESYDQAGEVLLKSPSTTLGYLEESGISRNMYTSDDWLLTGDVAMMRKGVNGTDHLFILDRIKDMIKVKVDIPNSENDSNSLRLT